MCKGQHSNKEAKKPKKVQPAVKPVSADAAQRAASSVVPGRPVKK